MSQKRMRPDSGPQLPKLTEAEQKLYAVIKGKTNTGMWTAEMKTETNLPQPAVTKALKGLQAKNLIKDVVSVRNKARKIFMAVEFEPSKEVSGGSWYSGGNLDIEFIKILRDQCLKHVERLKVATVENICESIRESRIFTTECTLQQILEIVRAMSLDKEIEEVKSTGTGDFRHIQAGKVCFRSLRGRQGTKSGVLSSIPCGVCPRIDECTPDGIVSPFTCVYYNKWLELDF